MGDFSRKRQVIADILKERIRQQKKWGKQSFTPPEWLVILGEEVGEANRAALEAHFPFYGKQGDLKALRSELIQVAAVAMQAVEDIDQKSEEDNAESKHTS